MVVPLDLVRKTPKADEGTLLQHIRKRPRFFAQRNTSSPIGIYILASVRFLNQGNGIRTRLGWPNHDTKSPTLTFIRSDLFENRTKVGPVLRVGLHKLNANADQIHSPAPRDLVYFR